MKYKIDVYNDSTQKYMFTTYSMSPPMYGHCRLNNKKYEILKMDLDNGFDVRIFVVEVK